MREHSLAKVPVLLVVGRKEAAERTVSIRRLGKEGQQVLPLDAALAALADEAVPPDVRRIEAGAAVAGRGRVSPNNHGATKRGGIAPTS